ncbi:MAG: CHASE2 domain-containing protein [Pseudanabaena sp. SU_2_4]|nr:CHASE2 domain-containing protein [Pseudanabaena sp. SU_2_4]
MQKLGQVGLADAVLDPDGRQRRGLLYLTDADSSFHESLGLKLALIYLSASDILPEAGSNNELRLKQTIFRRFQSLDGGYVRADDGGYQILLNWRGPSGSFATVSLLDVLQDRVSPQLIRDRIVLIGHNAASIKDSVLTPYSVASDRTTPENMTGVEVQANLASQIVSAVLDRRAAIQVWDEWLEWLWILGWATIGAGLSWNLRSVYAIALSGSLTGVGLTAGCYLAILAGWWIPVVPSGMALLVALVAIVAYKINPSAMPINNCSS